MRYVYLHGFASGPTSKKAKFFLDRLRSLNLPLQVPDLAEGDFEHLTLSRQLAVVEREVAGEESILIGSSLGGYLAALYAARHPHIRRLVLLAPAFCFPTRWAADLGPERMEEWRSSTGRLPVFHYAHGALRDLGYPMVEDARNYQDFPDFPQPALIFHGLRDDVVPHSLSQEFAACHPNVRLNLLDSDHALTGVLQEIWHVAVPFLTPSI